MSICYNDLLDLDKKSVRININGDWAKAKVSVMPGSALDSNGDWICVLCVKLKGRYKGFSFVTDAIFDDKDARKYETSINL